jgi:hypothetical protein
MVTLRKSLLFFSCARPISQTFGAGGTKVNTRLWLTMLRQWLERADAVEHNVDRQQALQDRGQLELRKAQATAWYFSPPY